MNYEKNKILVLGADGFIGSNMIEALIKEKNYSVRAFDFFRNGISRNLEPFREKIQFFPGDFLNRSDIRKSLKGVSHVFHFLSSTTPGSSMDDPLVDINTNVFGMLMFLDECVKADVKKIIFSSSGGTVYGNDGKNKCKEEDPTNPISPYGISKLTIEKYLEYYKIRSGLEYLILRYSNLYGPRQNISGSQGIIPIFLNLIKKEKPIEIFGDGKNIRDYLYIDDAIAVTKILFKKKTKYNIYNIGSGRGFSIIDVVASIEKLTGKKAKIKWMHERNTDVKKIILDISRAREETGYFPKISLKEGLNKTWEWIQKNS
jgi:UDP-glucose 4-epimerase